VLLPLGRSWKASLMPGIWMDHCHNLPHAAQELVAHLMYDGVSKPFRVGGGAEDQPE
jgi:hypothetical protein